MSEPRWTPGPWEADCPDDAQEWNINAPNGEPRLQYASWTGLAIVYGSEDWPGDGAAIGRANAHLIAAAPDLYEALEALVTVSTTPDERQRPNQWNDAWAAARAALRKARGET